LKGQRTQLFEPRAAAFLHAAFLYAHKKVERAYRKTSMSGI
jgi:hypothetical protein